MMSSQVCASCGAGQHAVAVLDPLRITVAVNGLGLTGFQCGTILEEQFGVVMELATQQVGDLHFVMLIVDRRLTMQC